MSHKWDLSTAGPSLSPRGYMVMSDAAEGPAVGVCVPVRLNAGAVMLPPGWSGSGTTPVQARSWTELPRPAAPFDTGPHLCLLCYDQPANRSIGNDQRLSHPIELSHRVHAATRGWLGRPQMLEAVPAGFHGFALPQVDRAQIKEALNLVAERYGPALADRVVGGR